MSEPPTEQPSDRQPLISFRDPEGLAGENGSPSIAEQLHDQLQQLQPNCLHWRQQARTCLDSQENHLAVLTLVTLDVLAVLANILSELVACDQGKQTEPWVGALKAATDVIGIVFSCLFVAELLVTIWAFGPTYFNSWFHCFDAAVIIASFVTDVLAKGVLEEIGSLVIVLRLWRMVKIVEEIGAGAAEQVEELEAKIEELERENTAMKAQLGLSTAPAE